jgi:PAS domain S-box-containing protein
LVWPRALPAPGFAVTVAAGFLIVETVLVVLLKQVEPEDPLGIVYAVLMGVALVGNFVAGVAAAASASADRRREAELSSDLAHMVLRTGDLQSAANEAGRHLAAAFNLRFASVELTTAAGDHRPGAIPLHEDDVLFGVLEVPDDLPRTTLERLLRMVPTLEALLAGARDRENVNNRLIESRHRLEQFFDLTSDLMVISDQGKLLKVNPAFEQALGYTVDDLAPAPFEIVPPEDMDRLREPIKNLTDGRPVRFENRVTTRDGSSRWIEWSVAPHQGLFYAVGRDVTGQREEEEQLRETRTMLEASRDTLRELAEHQAGLRRVATLVARGANPLEVFDAVYYEMARCMHVTDARLSRYDDDKTATILTARHEPGVQNLSGGTRLTLADDELLSKVLSTGQPARQGAAIRTALGVPVIVDGRVWGVLSAGSAEREPLSSDSEARIADFADLVATAIANTAAREQLDAGRERLRASRDRLRQLARHQTALRRVAELVAREAEPAEVFHAVAEEMATVLDVYNATVGRFDGDDIVMAAIGRPEVDIPNPPAVGERFPLDGDHVAVMVRRTGRPARMDSHEHAAGVSAARIRQMGIESMVAVPIMVGEHLWGVAAVAARGGPLPADTEVGVADFADLVATAIANAAAREQLNTSRDSLRQLARQQTALRRVAELVAREAEPAAVFNAVAEELASGLDANNATVIRYEGDLLVVEAVATFNQDLPPNPPAIGERLPLDGDHVGAMILRTGRAARMDSHTHAAGATAALIRGLGIQSMVGVPIVVGPDLWGAVAVASRTGPLPPDTEVRTADFAELVATSLANAATRGQLQTSRDTLRDLAGHQTALRRVAELVAREAEPRQVFEAVAEELAGCLGAHNASVGRFDGDAIVIEALGHPEHELANPPAIGERFPLAGDHIAPIILRTGRPARMDSHDQAAGATAARIREMAVQCMVGVPIFVGARQWGVLAVASRSGPLPADTEARMADFADLVATSIANAATRFELQASRDSLRELAENLSVLARQQAALRRVATLVARGVSQSEVFSAVAEEMAGCLNVGNAEVLRFEDDGAAIVVVASYADPGVPHLSLGERLSTEGDNVAATVSRTRQSARMDSWESAAGPIAQRVRELGVRSRIGAPIVVDERLWGIAVVATTEPEPLPPDTEARIVEFAELVATAIAAATTRAELIASRARIVAAADDARRRLERDIHDGAQQRLVSLGLKLRLTEESVPPERDDLKRMLSEAVSGLTDVFQELQELSRGIHPATLATGGLRAAFKTLARRSPVPVNLDVTIEQRLPESVEVAAYYVVAEALTNAAKHARASEVKVAARVTDTSLDLLIADDGIGGADTGKGSGLIGLKDRIEALGGSLRVASPPGGGTALTITIPHNRIGR